MISITGQFKPTSAPNATKCTHLTAGQQMKSNKLQLIQFPYTVKPETLALLNLGEI